MVTFPARTFSGPRSKSFLLLAPQPLTPLFENLTRLDSLLKEHGTPWALVGGLAVGARTDPRFTRDIDLAVFVQDDADAERIIKFLLTNGYRLLAVLEQTALSRLATVRLMPPDSERVADLLFASSGLELEIVRQAEMLEIAPGYVVPVARLAHLIAMKVLARNDQKRPQDRLDLASLLSVADENELDVCRDAIQLIVARGFHRGRPLLEELENTLNELRD